LPASAIAAEHPSLTASRPSFTAITDAAAWDEALLASENAGLLQSWRWGEFKRRSGWSPLRLTTQDLHSPDGASACAQVLFRKLPLLPISIAYVPRGPVYSGSGNAENAEKALWRVVHAEAKKRGAIFLKIEPNLALSEALTKAEVDRRMAGSGFRPAGRLQPARTIVLDINQSEDDLLKAMKPKTRYNVRLSERRGVQVRQAVNEADLRAFYDLLQVTSARDEFGIHTFEYYEQLWQLFGQGHNLLVLLADHPDEGERAQGPIAGLLALRFGSEAIYMYGASANRGREHMPTYLLQWEAIKWAQQRGCSIYDFWGIPDAPGDENAENDVSPTNTRSGLRGVYWFKKGFGGREVEYPGAYDYVYNALLYKLWMRWRGADLG
jgi:lipid II:glycine glycyltransferase (peptidoglycan interpeptide bridge formation enzyme)